MTAHRINLALPARVAILAALLCAEACLAATAPDHCIVGESVFGCRSERDIAQITAYRGDADALHEMIAADISSGACQMFKEGERVYRSGAASRAERAAVRRPDDATAYWMPASWSRPVSECAAYTAPRSIGANPGPGNLEGSAAAGKLSAPAALAQSAGSGCTIKPVMSDAEIAACRNINP